MSQEPQDQQVARERAKDAGRWILVVYCVIVFGGMALVGLLVFNWLGRFSSMG